MKYLGLFSFILTILSCAPKDKSAIETNSSKTNIETIKIVDNLENRTNNVDSGKIDSETELKKEWGNYIVRLNDSILSLCNHQILYNPFGTFDQNETRELLFEYTSSTDTFSDGIEYHY